MKLSLFPSLIVTDAFVTDQVVSWKLACQMEEVPGHGAAIPLTVGGSKHKRQPSSLGIGDWCLAA
jgi:hypothetical protein